MLVFIYLSIVGAIALFTTSLFISAKNTPIKTKLPQEAVGAEGKKFHSFLSYCLPFSQGLLERLKLNIAIKNKLDAAHVRLSVSEFFNLKLLLMLLLGVLGCLGLRKFDPLILLVGMAFGYIIPEIYLSRKIIQRRHAIVKVMPETVDLLGLCVEAGLDFIAAARWIIEKVPANPMIEELAFVLEEIRWGKSRIQALKDMAKRLNIAEISSFVQTLAQAERMGASVSEAFAILSEDTRLQRFHRGERIAMQAPIKILIPLIFCILPVIGIVIGGPIFLQFMQGGLFKQF